jgi:hypothetical protein
MVNHFIEYTFTHNDSMREQICQGERIASSMVDVGIDELRPNEDIPSCGYCPRCGRADLQEAALGATLSLSAPDSTYFPFNMHLHAKL